MLNACIGYHIYSGVNAITTVSTGKAIPDHLASTGTGADCNAINVVYGLYYCEVPKEAGTTYNRSVF